MSSRSKTRAAGGILEFHNDTLKSLLSQAEIKPHHEGA